VTKSLLIIREGHGEAGSIENLVARVGIDLDVFPTILPSIRPSIRMPVTSVKTAVRAGEVARVHGVDALLITADCDDACPRDHAPVLANAVRELKLPFPAAVVLFYREFETMAVATADSLAGRTLSTSGGQEIATLQAPVEVPPNPEVFRDAKGWVGTNLLGGGAYKPTVHQMALTRSLDIDELRVSGLSSFRRLESAVRFLGEQVATQQRGVYPAVPA
jgi:hypothetical protein